MAVCYLNFQKLSPDAKIPCAATPGDALDVWACLKPGNTIHVPPGETVKVPTGLSCEFELGWRMLLFARSGNALKHSITLQNAVGVIDPGYRGEICLLIRNEGQNPFIIDSNKAIGQLVMVESPDVRVREVVELSRSERGTGGFGSTDCRTDAARG